ncbi:MAG: SDR family NAD(P)-dependent oxidoreductase [Phycisphaerae bacterium]
MPDANTRTLQDKVVLLTGSTGPMGRVLVDAFLEAGARLALCVRRMAHLPALDQRLADQHQTAMILPCDLRYEENVVRMVHRVVQRFGRIDVIVSAAAIGGPAVPIIDYPVDPWRDVLATNLTGAYLVCREALPWMIRQRSGSIIHTTSSPAAAVRPGGGALLVSQYGIGGLTRLLAAELKDTGVRVNTVDVGPVTPDLKPTAPEAEWVRAYLWLAGDASAGQSGERIRATGFSP